MPQPFQRPPWCKHSERDYKSFHICLDLSKPEPQMSEAVQKQGMPQDQRDQIAEAQRKRWARVKAAREAGQTPTTRSRTG